MPLLIRIPTLLVALGLLLSGGQARVCDLVSLVGIDFHGTCGECAHSKSEDGGHSHSHEEPCSEGCFVELNEGVAPAPDSIPSPLVTEGLDYFLSVNFISHPEVGFFDLISDVWHGPPLEFPTSIHSDPVFSGRFLV